MRFTPFAGLILGCLAALPAVSAGSVPRQDSASRPVVSAFRIPVRSANPWFIKAMLEGSAPTSPEFTLLAQLFGMPNMGQALGNAVSSLVKNGHLVVNPTDNSIWFYPDR